MLLAAVFVGCVAAQYEFVVPPFRFGNYFIALTNALFGARQCTSGCSVVQRNRTGLFAGFPERLEFGAAAPTAKLTPHQVWLEYQPTVGRFVKGPEPTWIDRWQTFAPYRHYTGLVASASHADTLVMHVRGGDIFRQPHKKYWQPPLGYYQYCARNYSALAICSEDERNPVVRALFDYCIESRGVDNCLLRINQPLNADVAFLAAARQLVVGFGTFLPAVLALSTATERLFYPFTMDWYLDVRSPPPQLNRTLRVTRVAYDASMQWTKDPWRSSPQQRALLLTNETALRELAYETRVLRV